MGGTGVIWALPPAPTWVRMGTWLEVVGWLSWDRCGQWCLFSSNAGFGTAARSVGMFLFEIWGFYLKVEGSGLLGPHPALAMRVLDAGGWEPGIVLSPSQVHLSTAKAGKVLHRARWTSRLSL